MAMSEKKDSIKWSKYADKYEPIKIGSIDGMFLFINLFRFHIKFTMFLND